MLIQFNFQNFKSFRDETTLDLSATKITEFSNHVVSIGKEKLLPIATIFGANAHGKSNIVDAFRFMKKYVISSFAFGGDNNKNNNEVVKPIPFLFDKESKKLASLFEVFFIDSEKDGAKTYNYGFTVNQLGVNEEWLNYKTKTSTNYKKIFYRNEEKKEMDLSGIPKISQENIIIALEKESLIVSLGAKLKIEKLKHIRDWFFNCIIADYGNPKENLSILERAPNNFDSDKSLQQKVIKYLSSFDSGIIDFIVEPVKSENSLTYMKINTVHKMIGSDEIVAIPLDNESSGTLKMFSMFPMLEYVLDNGGVFFVDELNSRLHPLLVRNILITFFNKEINRNNAQLVFTTHDAWQLSGSGLRRDEIWFTEKDENGVSTLFSLADFLDDDGTKIRKDENYEKNYLLGKYGAIPSLHYIEMFLEK